MTDCLLGYCYISNGSVYFDSVSFAKLSPQKLAPAKMDDDLYAASESNEFVSEKKNPRDFALWKCNSNDEEIGWENPYSTRKGRSLLAWWHSN